MKAYDTQEKSTSVRRKPVPQKPSSIRRKPVSRQNSETATSTMSTVTSSLPDSLTIIDSQAQQVESTSTTPGDRTLGWTSKSIAEVSNAPPDCNLSKHPSHPYLSQFSEDSSPPKANGPWIAGKDRDILENVETVPVQLAPVQPFISEDIEDKKRRRRKAIRNGVRMYVAFNSELN